ncbi:MAG: hypothetical protein INH37_14785 [Myxococcaceae bacterium]|nr:hypothetical protein [Myxococcaceae bacterium]
MAVNLTTELEAVNAMLIGIGEDPVNSLDTAATADVAVAKQILREVSREVQSDGWDFNSETEFPLTRGQDGTITVPPNVLSLDISDSMSARFDITVRGRKVYDKVAHGFTFAEDLKVDVVWLLEFEELPETARRYIALAAAERFQKRVLGSTNVDRGLKEDLAMAQAIFMGDEGKRADDNILSGNWGVFATLNRNTIIVDR